MNAQMETRLRTKDVLAALNVSQSTLYLMMKEGRFPRPFKAGSRLCFWKQSDVDECIQETFSGTRSEGKVLAPDDSELAKQFITDALSGGAISVKQLHGLAQAKGVSSEDVEAQHGILYRTYKPRPHADALAKLI